MTVIPIGRGRKTLPGTQKRPPTRAEISRGSEKRATKEIVSVVSEIEAAIPRDRWDRPLIVQEEGDPLPYRRASTVSDMIEDYYGLNVWKRRLTVEGLAQRPDLIAAILAAKNLKTGEWDKRAVDEAMEVAFLAAGGDVAARQGTAMHQLTEQLDTTGDVPTGLPSNIVAMLEKYQKAMKRFEIIDRERFVVQDKIRVAGTYDARLLDKKYGVKKIGDLKTGQNLEHMATKTPAQIAVYAAGKLYDLDGGREDLGVDRDQGVLIWLPWVEDPQHAECEIHDVDLVTGRKVIMEAFRVDKFRKLRASQTMPRSKG